MINIFVVGNKKFIALANIRQYLNSGLKIILFVKDLQNDVKKRDSQLLLLCALQCILKWKSHHQHHHRKKLALKDAALMPKVTHRCLLKKTRWTTFAAIDNF